LFLILFSLAGCSTSQKELLPVPEGRSMRDVWDDKAASGPAISSANSLNSVVTRAIGNRPSVRENIHYSRNVTNEINSQFVRLPNPDLVIYIFPHLVGRSGEEQVPVPGYSTLFPLYAQPKYAMPGELALPTNNAVYGGREL
jgi:conjugative transfer region lipoprotein (TIGR03751 family)